MQFKKKTVVITGAGGVLCGAFAKAFAQRGANVALLDLNFESADKIAQEIRDQGYVALAIAANVLEKESLENACNIVYEKFGSCDILINGAGGNHKLGTTTKEFLEKEDLLNEDADFVSFFNLDPKGIEFVFNLNFLGTLLPSQVFGKKMAFNEGSAIINVSSMNAFTPLTKIPAYSGAKAAVSNFTQWLAVHFSKANIRVNAIAPGFFLTAQNEKLLVDENGNFTPRAEKIIANTPMGRFGNADELIGAICFLADSNLSSFVNGVVLPVDGGFAAYSGV
ncbi:MAG: SDR family oxidoreductase [Spirochaetales bacterium]|nr:SDR family oxidoreductase [Spirochaetales bacterium]